MDSSQLVDVQTMAEILKVPASWVYSRTRNNSIPFIKCGRYCRFVPDDVISFLKKQSEDETSDE